MSHLSNPPSFILTPDSFKGSLSAVDFCQQVSQTLLQHIPSANVASYPLSDGGEGWVDAFVCANKAQVRHLKVQDPLGRLVSAQWAWQADKDTAIIEMAQASGLPLLTEEEKQPLVASTYGTGQLLVEALQTPAQSLVLGLGGSATNDGGAGALRALGFRFLDEQGHEVVDLPEGFLSVVDIRPPENYADLLSKNWWVACDVTNPLLGPTGATSIFGPQKGVTAELLPLLEARLAHFAQLIIDLTGRDIRGLEGAGAAGGMAGGFMGLLNAQVRPGFELLAQQLDLESVFATAPAHTWVITGEGRMDQQTQFGKLPARIATLAERYQLPCYAFCGQLEGEMADFALFEGVSALNSLAESGETWPQICQKTPERLQQLVREWLVSRLGLALP